MRHMIGGAVGLAIGLSFAIPTARGADMTADFFVAVDGNDANHGTKEKPFATLVRARDAARQLGTNQVRRIVVRGGKYYQVSLALGPRDSGLIVEAAPGETPVLHGGRLVRDWEKDGEKFHAARLPGVKERTWDFRSLVVNGKLRPRARLPETGEYTHLTRFDAKWHLTSGGGFRGADTPELKLKMQYRKEDLGDWLDVNNAELTIYHQWDDSVVGLKSHDPATQTLTFANPAGYPPGAFAVRTYVVWNIREGMHQPGQWYLDRTRGMVVYWPLPGEDMVRAEAVAPTAECVIRLDGTREVPATGVTLKGLRISATSTPLVAGGWAAGAFKGAVEARFTRDCRFTGLRVTGVGGHGIRQQDSARNLIEGCEVADTGAGGIYDARGVGGRIVSNRIAGVGRTYTSAMGLQIAGGGQKNPELSHDNDISHNEVRDVPYVGIQFDGWRNRFERNLVCDVMKVLRDGAAFYGAGRENVIRGNVVRDIPPGKLAHAYYIDELAEGCLVEGNAAIDCEWPAHMHMTTNCILRNNLFVSRGASKLTFPRSTGFSMTRNLVFAVGEIRVENPIAVAAWESNLFFSVAGQYRNVPDSETRANPLFVDPDKGDYRLKPESPSFKSGFMPVDTAGAGIQVKEKADEGF